MEEIKLNMENLSKEEREQLLKLVEKANKQSGVWKPACDEYYYYIDSEGCVFSIQWIDDIGDIASYQIGNCFKTKEEAEFALERHKVMVELERFAKENNDPILRPCWILRYDNVCSFSSVTGTCGTYNYGATIIPAFTSEDIAMKAIDAIGKDRLKKYYFGIKE